MGRTCEHKAEHAGPPTAESLPEWCEQEPWPPPSCRHPMSPHPRPLAVTSHSPSLATSPHELLSGHDVFYLKCTTVRTRLCIKTTTHHSSQYKLVDSVRCDNSLLSDNRCAIDRRPMDWLSGCGGCREDEAYWSVCHCIHSKFCYACGP